jgi:uncharacterized protein (DUF111 family)
MKNAVEEVLQLLGMQAAGGKAWDDEAATAVFGIVSILFCLELLDVTSSSYSPLPLGTDAGDDENDDNPRPRPAQTRRCLAGLNVIAVSGPSAATPVYDACAVALLKVPFGTRRTAAGAVPPTVTLLGQHVGTDEDPKHGTVRVTLTLGTLLLSDPRDCRDPSHRDGSLPSLLPSSSLPWKSDRVVLLETNVDDMTAEHGQFLMELLLGQPGTLDAWTTPIGMKKGRAAACALSVLCEYGRQNDLLLLLFRHSTTLGVRHRTLDRAALRRRVVTVEADWKGRSDVPHHGKVDVKVGYLLHLNPGSQGGDEEIASMKPEFDHCRDISLATGIPIKCIADEALQLAKQRLNGSKFIEDGPDQKSTKLVTRTK